MFRRLLSHTIWAPDAIGTHRRRFSGIYRWILPLTDLSFFWVGSVCWLIGSPYVESLIGDAHAHTWAAILTLASFTAGCGLIFRLPAVEATGKIITIGAIWYYVAAVWIVSNDYPDAVANASIFIAVSLLPLWRLRDLGYIVWLKQRPGAEENPP